jgi:hypothetical protein
LRIGSFWSIDVALRLACLVWLTVIAGLFGLGGLSRLEPLIRRKVGLRILLRLGTRNTVEPFWLHVFHGIYVPWFTTRDLK